MTPVQTHNQEHIPGGQTAQDALVRFSDEELTHQKLFTQVHYQEIRFEPRPDYCNTPIQTGNKNPLARNHADTRRA